MRYFRLKIYSLALLSACSHVTTAKLDPGPDVVSSLELRQPINSLVESKHGEVYLAADSGLYVLRQRGAKPIRVASGEFVAIEIAPSGIVFSRDDSLDNRIHLYALNVSQSTAGLTGQVRRLSTSSASFPSASPDGRRLAYSIQFSGTEHGIGIADVDGSGERLIVKRPGRIAPIRWSRDGWLYYGLRVIENGRLGEIRVERVRSAGGEPELVLRLPFAHRSISTDPAWPGLSPGGDRIAVQAPQDSMRQPVIQLYSLATRKTQIIPVPHYYRSITWSADGRSLIAVDSSAIVRYWVR
jgi:Tol biopolymer transport system component